MPDFISNIANTIINFASTDQIILSAIVIGALSFSAAYRYFSEERFDSILMTLVLFNIVEAAILGVKSDRSLSLLAFPGVLAFALAGVSLWQGQLTKRHVRSVIESHARKDVEHYLIQKYIDLGEIMIEVDIFPGKGFERILKRKESLREHFVNLLPDSIFTQKNDITPDDLVLPEQDRKYIKWATNSIMVLSVMFLIAMLVLEG